ncbi:MAG: Gfo/Idh/MocA family oxidoreductase [Saprospiraceae bacterium]|nr:Gfo/Idh/MocA family oxidoreductase [Saprospiraceae bacterium]
MIRAGIIGWGENGKKIAEALHFKIKNTEVIGVATDDPIGRDFAMRKMGLKHVFSNHTQLLELHQIDIICICSEGDIHFAHVDDALKSGSNIFIDHPLACNVEDCTKIVKLLDSYPSYKTTVAFPRRFISELNQMQKLISEGRLGEILRIECQTFEKMQIQDALPNRKMVRKGIFMDLMLQDIDMVKWLTGQDYQTVYVVGNALKYPSLQRQGDVDSAIAIAKLKKGCMVNFISSRLVHQGEGFKVKVVGTLGEVNYSSFKENAGLVSNQDGKPYYMSKGKGQNEYIPLIQNYVDAVKNGSKIKYDLKDATEATRIAVAMTKSFLLGREVSLIE